MAVPGMIFGAHYAWNPAEDSVGKTDGNTAEKVLFNIEEYAKNIGAGIIYISHDDRVVNRCKYVIKLVNQLKFANK